MPGSSLKWQQGWPCPQSWLWCPPVKFPTLQKYNWVPTGAKTLERGGDGLREMWERARVRKPPFSPVPSPAGARRSPKAGLRQWISHPQRHQTHRDEEHLLHQDPHMLCVWGRGCSTMMTASLIADLGPLISCDRKSFWYTAKAINLMTWSCSQTWEQIRSIQSIISMYFLFSEKLTSFHQQILCVLVYTCACVCMCHICVMLRDTCELRRHFTRKATNNFSGCYV